MEVWDCLPADIAPQIRSLNDVREIRLRNGMPVRVNVGGTWYFLCRQGLSQQTRDAVLLSEDCDVIVRRACNSSVYAYEKMLAKGFFTLADGVRVGVCGEIGGGVEPVFRRYTSACFRIPHHIALVSSDLLEECERGSVAVVGPPGSGKTTFLRDLAVKLSVAHNVLVTDERGELFYDAMQANSNCDVLKWCSKTYAFEIGVRSMSPHWIICDEISKRDEAAISNCIQSGVNVGCSIHGGSVRDVQNRLSISSLFYGFVVLDEKHGKPHFVANLDHIIL